MRGIGVLRERLVAARRAAFLADTLSLALLTGDIRQVVRL